MAFLLKMIFKGREIVANYEARIAALHDELDDAKRRLDNLRAGLPEDFVGWDGSR